MSLTLITLSNNPKNLKRLLEWAVKRPAFDEIRVFLDNKIEKTFTPKDFTKVLPESYRARIGFEYIPVPNIDRALAYMRSDNVIKTDWALQLHDDELMGEWFDRDIERLMDLPYDVFLFPRYNLAEGDEGWRNTGEYYHFTGPLYPDYSQRLFRPGYLITTGEVHDNPKCTGRLSVAQPHVFHFEFLERSREEREAKWKRYVKLGVVEASRRHGLSDDHYRRWSLPEDYELGTAICKERII